jgi:hypothetical protein
MATGCATTPKVPVVGRTVTVVRASEETDVRGELLAVEEDRLWVRNEDELMDVPLPAVREVRVKQHDFDGGRAIKWALLGGVATGGALAGACSSVEGTENCGVFGLIVAGAWLLVGILAAPSLEASSHLEIGLPRPEELRPFARLPQGLPPALRPPTLRFPVEDPPRDP